MNNSNEIKMSKILIVDDSQLDCELLNMVLEKKYLTHTLLSGKSCIETIEVEKPDIVLLDVIMPDINGIQLLIAIRKKWSQIELPVIMITANSEADDVANALELGANDYITKPVDFVVAIKRIETHLLIASSSKEMAHFKELSTINSMIATYNHEIRNPLAIAIYALDDLKESCSTLQSFKKLETALWRISDVIKKTGKILKNGNVEHEEYTSGIDMIKLNK